MKKVLQRIQDKDITEANYSKFAKCEIIHGGSAVRFKYPSQDVYEVDIKQILSWFQVPHYVCSVGKVDDWPDGQAYTIPSAVSVRAIRRILSGHALRVYMTDSTAYDVAWDTVLMACEPRYEWFGGLSRGVK